MTNSLSSYLRRGGLALLAGAAITVAGSIVVAIARASTSVAHDLFSYPLSHDQFVAISLIAALSHALIGVGAAWLRRTARTAQNRPGRIGLTCVIAGTALLFVCELASLPLANQHNTDTWPRIVDAGFGAASVLVTFGMLAVGIATVRERGWSAWRRFAPLICGALSLTTIPLQFTSAIELAIGLYGVGYAVLGVAMVTDPATRTSGAAVQLA